MYIIKPQNIKFETTSDIVDYVSKGLPPSKEDYKKLMSGYLTTEAEANDQVVIDEEGNEITPNVKPEEIQFGPLIKETDAETRRTVYDIVDRVYENRVRQRNLILGVSGLIVGGCLIHAVSGHNKKKKDDDD